jgi:bifunctional non-homologous end joining protein LigD
MLLSPVAKPPSGDGWAHEPKLDGWRAIVQISGGKVHVWSRNGKDWCERIPELKVLADLDAVIDGELVVVAPDGRADFHVLGARLSSRSLESAVSLYAFDVLALDGDNLVDRPWRERRAVLDNLDLAGRSDGIVRTMLWSEDGAAMHVAGEPIGAEGTTSKRVDSPYRPGRSRAWVKAKHKHSAEFQVVGWRPSTVARPGGLIIAERGEQIGTATISLPDAERTAIVELLHRYGRLHPSGAVTIPDDCITATVHYTSRTPTYCLLREAFVVSVSAR